MMKVIRLNLNKKEAEIFFLFMMLEDHDTIRNDARRADGTHHMANRLSEQNPTVPLINAQVAKKQEWRRQPD